MTEKNARVQLLGERTILLIHVNRGKKLLYYYYYQAFCQSSLLISPEEKSSFATKDFFKQRVEAHAAAYQFGNSSSRMIASNANHGCTRTCMGHCSRVVSYRWCDQSLFYADYAEQVILTPIKRGSLSNKGLSEKYNC